MQHVAMLALALATLATAIVAAVYWFQSAAVPTPHFEEPNTSIDDAPEDHIRTAVVNSNYIREAMDKSSKLNKRAALWTGVSALLGAITAVLSV